MEHMILKPERLYRRFQPNTLTGDKVHSLDLMSPYLNITPFIDFIQSLEDSGLRNIWNSIAIQWSSVRNKLSDNTSFHKSKYKKQTYPQVHATFGHKRFDEILNEFIDGDTMKGLFVLKCIMKYVFFK